MNLKPSTLLVTKLNYEILLLEMSSQIFEQHNIWFQLNVSSMISCKMSHPHDKNNMCLHEGELLAKKVTETYNLEFN